MPRARSADALTAATTSILVPFMQQHGFRRVTNRMIGRVSEDIYQFLYLQLSAGGDRWVCPSYASNALFNPRDYEVLQPGSRLHDRRGADVWLRFSVQSEADASMREFVRLTARLALPFFASTSTVEGLLGVLERERWGSNHHLCFEIACCLVKLGRLTDARDRLERAIQLYVADGRDWCQEGIDRSNELLLAIERGANEALLADWTRYSIEHLNLARLCSP